MKGLQTALVAAVALGVLAAGVAAHDLGKGIESLSFVGLGKASKGDWLLVLYAPWCGHCKRLLRELPGAAERLQERGISVAAVNADEHPAAGMQFCIKGYPTVFRLHNGEAYEMGPSVERTQDAIVQWATAAWQEQEPIRGLKAPCGVPMRAWGWFSLGVIRLVRLNEQVAHRLGTKPRTVAMIGTAAAIVLMTAVALVIFRDQFSTTTTKAKKNTKKQAKKKQAKKKQEDKQQQVVEQKPEKKATARQRRKDAQNAQLTAQALQRERLANPIARADVENERVEEAVKALKEEQKRQKRAAELEEQGERRKQAQQAQKRGQGKGKQSRPQQNRPTQQPTKRS